jgi:hypothetical protein
MLKVFSFCLYGSNPKYTLGMIENIKIINEYFNEWYTYIYYNNIPSDILEKIKTFNNVVLINSTYNNYKTTLDRFKSIDITNVEIMMVRDADSRIHERDRWAINEFIKSNKKLHIIRDHTAHQRPILAGLFGIKKGLLKFKIEDKLKEFEINNEDKYGVDEKFLEEYIYHIAINNNDYLLHGHKIPVYEVNIPFPFHPINNNFCGQVVEYNNGKPYNFFKYQ